MREKVTEAQLCLDGPGGFTYVLGLVSYIVREDDSFRYELEPDYAVIGLLSPPDFQGIPGFDLSLRKPRYERVDRIPTLIADRAPYKIGKIFGSSWNSAVWNMGIRWSGL